MLSLFLLSLLAQIKKGQILMKSSAAQGFLSRQETLTFSTISYAAQPRFLDNRGN